MDSTESKDGKVETNSPPPTPPFPLHIQISGLEEDKANELGQFVGDLVREAIKGGLDLRSLEKIWLTNAYATDLASIDRGFEPSSALTPTNEEFATGVAMVVHVKRGDEYKCQMVMEVSLAASALYAEDEVTRVMATATLVHEMAHVHDFGQQCRMMPHIMFKAMPRSLGSWLYQATNGVWSEYFACCVAAPLDSAVLQWYVETFLKALEAFPEAVRMAIVAYRTNSDLDGLLAVVQDRLGALFKFAGYVIGYLEGTKQCLAEIRPEDWARIHELGFAPTWEALTAALVEMHDTYSEWTSLKAFDGLGEVFRGYLKEKGIDLQPRSEGFHVNIPFTKETMPPETHILFDLGIPIPKM